MKTRHIFIFSLLLLTLNVFAQGDKYFENKQYQAAIATYNQEVSANSEKYLNLAKSYFAIKDFPNAMYAMQNYKQKYSKADVGYADWFIDILKRSDNDVPMKPVAGLINTSGGESVPRISADGKRLYFKSIDRVGGMGGEDIWYSEKMEDGTWGKPILFTDLCTKSHETLYTMSADGKLALLFGNYPGSFGGGDMFYSVKTGAGWSSPCNVGGTINTSKWEAQGTISPDGKVLIYVTANALNNHVGSHDLYMSRLTADGWTKPVNLGTSVNTKGSETRPSFAADGKTLYFSSDGYKSFGGSDIYMTRRLDETYTNWSEPVNLGRFINTLQDDEDISVNSIGTIGYTVKDSEVGAPGGLDIFQFVLPEIARPEKTITLYGVVTNEKDSVAAVNLRIKNLRTNTLQTVTPSSGEDGKYSVNLPFDKYLLEINMKGFLYYSQEIDLSDPNKFLPKLSIRDKIGTETQHKMDSLMVHADALHFQLKELNTSVSEDIKGSFELYENVFADYNKTLSQLQNLTLERKYAWLSEEKRYVDVEQNFKVQRATKGATFKLDNIFFDLGKATLKDESLPALNSLYDILLKNKIDIELGGHSDSIGSSETNLRLSQERVNSVKKYLLNKGIAESRIVAVGYGKEQPIASNSTEEGRAKNRRVEVKIIDNTPKGREGEELNLVEKKAETKVEAQVAEPQPKEDFDMLLTLQHAAKIGGLPTGSLCGDGVQATNVVAYVPTTAVVTKPSKPINYNSFFDHDQFDDSDYIYNSFNIGYENFSNYYAGASTGFSIRFINKKKFESKGNARENNLIYYVKNGNISFGAGYNYVNFNSLKKLTGLPFGFVWGVEGKIFKMTNNDYHGYIAIPLGLRGLINVSKFVICPDILFNYAVYSPQIERNVSLTSSYTTLGVTARWKFIYGGVQYNIGKSINYFGLRGGVSF